MGDSYVEIDLEAGNGSLYVAALEKALSTIVPAHSIESMMHGPRCSTCGRLIDHPGRCEPCRIADPDTWLTKRQSADVAQVHPRTIERWIRYHGLPSGGPGRVRIQRRDLDEFLRRHRCAR